MAIYTKTGDAGETALFGGSRVQKDHLRVEVYGTVDELNAVVGWARAFLEDAELDRELAQVQDRLFATGAELATPAEAKARRSVPPVEATWAEDLERAIDRWDAELPALKRFVQPGGSRAAAALHLARCVCRRAERRVVTLQRQTEVNPLVLVYLNRLSDFFFMAARAANHRAKVAEAQWGSARSR